MKLLQQARIVVEGNTTKCCDILFDEKGIHDIQAHIDEARAQECIQACGKYVFPGFIDVHVHLRDPGFCEKETIKTGTQAGAHGGFTTLMAMPNVVPYPDNVDTMKAYLAHIQQEALVHVLPYACITKGEKGDALSDMQGLSTLGIHAFSDDGVGVKNASMMEEAMRACQRVAGMIVAHTEDMRYRPAKGCMHEGVRNKELGLVGIPSACEYKQLHRDLMLAEKTHCRYHVCHLSALESVAELRAYKAKGVDCSGEVSAHHLLLNEMDVVHSNHKMNPPLRSEKDRLALVQGLLDGTIDFIASDHAPHREEEKDKGMEDAPFGVVSLETAFPLLYTRFVKEEGLFTLAQLLYWMSEAPAKRFGLERKGVLAPGYAADMILVDLDQAFTIHKEAFFSKGKNTPFDGVRCFGTIEKTYVDGCVVYDKEEHR